MGSQNSKAEAVQAADSWSRTHAKTFKCGHAWNIRNFTVLFADKSLRSSPFHAKDCEGIRWFMELRPSQSKGLNDSISLFIHMRSRDLSPVQFRLDLSVLDYKHGVIGRTMWTSGASIKHGQCYRLQTIHDRQSLLTYLDALPSDDITVFCEMSFATDVAVTGTHDPPRCLRNSAKSGRTGPTSPTSSTNERSPGSTSGVSRAQKVWNGLKDHVQEQWQETLGPKLGSLKSLFEKCLPDGGDTVVDPLVGHEINWSSPNGLSVEMEEMTTPPTSLEDELLLSDLEMLRRRSQTPECLKVSGLGDGSSRASEFASTEPLLGSVEMPSTSTHRPDSASIFSEIATDDQLRSFSSNAESETSTQPMEHEVPAPPAEAEEVASSCPFCSASHSPADCDSELTVEEKRHRLCETGFCLKCLNRGHTANNCVLPVRCCLCSESHHRIICETEFAFPSEVESDDSETNSVSSSFSLISEEGGTRC